MLLELIWLVHLPEDVKRFGPPILYATEAFKSFNSIIREKSVHSSRAAYSKDTARSFARWETLRHMVNGGWYQVHGKSGWYRPGPKLLKMIEEGEIRQLLDSVQDKRARTEEAGKLVVGLNRPVESYLAYSRN